MFRGSFLVGFQCGVFESVLCSACDLSLPFFGFGHKVELLCFSFFLFSLSEFYSRCVLSMHSSRGRLRAMCGSRAGGWSLPGVMSD